MKSRMSEKTPPFTHLNTQGQPSMVDVSEKIATTRHAIAQARVKFLPSVAKQLSSVSFHSKKGPILETAIIAGTMAAKRTYELIPFCHLLPLEHCEIKTEFTSETELVLQCEVRAIHKTGVEMEALTGVSVAALTVYDMCKALSHEITINNIQLLEKSGGKRNVRKGVIVKEALHKSKT